MNMYFASPDIVHSKVFEDKNDALVFNTLNRTNPRTRHIYVKYHLFRENVGGVKGIMIQRVESK